VREAKADLLHAIYERIVVAGRFFESARLTPAAYAHGLALAVPEKAVMARPEGFGRATRRVERRQVARQACLASTAEDW
jgi:hypothetical protein